MTNERMLKILETHFEVTLVQVGRKHAPFNVLMLRHVLALLAYKAGTHTHKLDRLLNIDRASVYYYINKGMEKMNEPDGFFKTLYEGIRQLIKEKEAHV